MPPILGAPPSRFACSLLVRFRTFESLKIDSLVLAFRFYATRRLGRSGNLNFRISGTRHGILLSESKPAFSQIEHSVFPGLITDGDDETCSGASQLHYVDLQGAAFVSHVTLSGASLGRIEVRVGTSRLFAENPICGIVNRNSNRGVTSVGVSCSQYGQYVSVHGEHFDLCELRVFGGYAFRGAALGMADGRIENASLTASSEECSIGFCVSNARLNAPSYWSSTARSRVSPFQTLIPPTSLDSRIPDCYRC